MNATQLLANFDRLAEAPDAVLRLRRFILDLAVRGKLVEQDARDEPAECLLEQCELERIKAVETGLVRKEKKLPPIFDDVPYPLPVGWVWTRLGSTGRIFNGDSVSEGEKAELSKVADGHPFIATKDVGYGWQQLNYENGLRVPVGASALKVLRANSVLICAEGGSAGKKTGLTDRDICFGNKLFANEPWNGINASYLLALYQSSFFYTEFSSRMTGIIGGISRSEFVLLPVPIPPAEEQIRIVAKVYELMALCDQLETAQQERERRRDRLAAASLQRLNQPAADTTPEVQREHAHFHLHHLPRLTTHPEHIKALRQTVLNLAVRGRLVSQDSNDVPVAKALAKVIKQFDVSEPFAIPASWSWVRVGDAAQTRLGKMLDKAKNKGTPRRYLRNVNVRWFDFDLSDVFEMRFENSELTEFALKRGDVLICEGGEPGRVAVWDERENDIYFQKAIHRVRFPIGVNPHYFANALREAADSGRLATYFTGVGIKHFTGRGLASFSVPLPPLAEQHRIVAKVDELMALCDQLEAQLTTTQTDSRRLLEAVLEAALAPA
ncbi:MAG: restriction endonuclease subunit S [Burkholderiales bacterium]|nr:restriction endonuclease subunit S [Burkholderiales bacterium]